MAILPITVRAVRRARRHYGLKVYHHDQWGSQHRGVYAWRRKHMPVSVIKADTIVQHITVTLDTGPLTGQFHADARTVERIGMERFGSGVSYNWLVDMATGEVAVGQPLDAKGTHTVNSKNVPGYSYDQNAVARAIAVIGMTDTPLAAKAEDSISRLIAAMMDVGACTPDPDYDPHSKFAWKDCPCDATRDRMGVILKRAKEYHTGVRPARRVTRVSKARKIIGDALALLRLVPKSRAAAHAGREQIEEALEKMPKR